MKIAKPHISKFWNKLIGSERAALEHKIFNGVSIFAIFTATLNCIINFWLGLEFYAFLMLPIILVLIIGYYLSRYKFKLSISVVIFSISFNALCAATYFSSNASHGVNLYTFILIIFLLTIVSPKKLSWVLVPLNIILLAGLIYVEYTHPFIVKSIYANEKVRLLDISQTLFEIIIMITMITFFMKNSYNKERALAKKSLEELEKSNETKKKLFSIVAHDLKSPLASIENYLYLLSMVELDAKEKAEIEKNLLSSTRQTSEMLQNILVWSNEQMDGVTVKLKKLNIHETLINTIALQNNLALEKEIKLNYEPNDQLYAIADTDLLQLVVRNLLNNAIKFSPNGASIQLVTKEDHHNCLISISDTGIGISEAEKPFVFSLKNTVTFGTNKEKGVGLGLKLAKTYVELQNGKIWFESEVGKGTTFYISLPIA